MSDPIFHSAEQKSFTELREQFREANRQRIHRTLREDSITFRDAAGNLLRDSQGEVVRKKTGYLTDAPAGRDHRRLDEFRAAREVIPAFSNEFIIPESPGLQRELRDLSRDATLVECSESVIHPGVEPMAPPLESLDDAAVLDYTESLVNRDQGDENDAKN